MKKDKTITSFIDRLKLISNFNLVEIVDYWEADFCAIGIKRGNRLIYISTFNDAERYDYDLELLNEQKMDDIKVIKEGRGVSEDVLINVLKEFLNI